MCPWVHNAHILNWMWCLWRFSVFQVIVYSSVKDKSTAFIQPSPVDLFMNLVWCNSKGYVFTPVLFVWFVWLWASSSKTTGRTSTKPGRRLAYGLWKNRIQIRQIFTIGVSFDIFTSFPGNNSRIMMKTSGIFTGLISVSVSNLAWLNFRVLLGPGRGMSSAECHS